MLEFITNCILTSSTITKYYIYIFLSKTKSRTYIRRTPNVLLALVNMDVPGDLFSTYTDETPVLCL